MRRRAIRRRSRASSSASIASKSLGRAAPRRRWPASAPGPRGRAPRGRPSRGRRAPRSSRARSPAPPAAGGSTPGAPRGRRRCDRAPRSPAAHRRRRGEPNTSAKTASNAGTWARLETSDRARRPVQAPPGHGPRQRRAPAAKRAARSAVTGTPASCSRRAKAPANAGRSSSTVRTRHGSLTGRLPPSCPRPPARTSSWSSAYFSTVPSVRSIASASRRLHAEQLQRGHPVDRLGDARRLLQVGVAQRGRPRRPPGRPASPPRRRHAPADDLDLAGRRRVVDPVVQAAALERVVQVARAVGGQHDRRRVAWPGSCPSSGMRHRRLGQQLQQERLELVVGAVDLVDQQHRRARARVLKGTQQRPGDQVVGPEQVRPRRAAGPTPRPGGCPAAGAGSSTRTAPRRRRCPRSTAGGPAACRAPGPAPWPPRSCRRPPRPPAAAAGAGAG